MLKKICAVLGLFLALYLGRVFRVSQLAVAAVAPAVGRGGACTYGKALRTYPDRLAFDEEWRKLVENSRRLRTEGGLTMWSTPRGDYWAPDRTDLLFVLAEQVREFYGTGSHSVHPGDIVLDAGANVGTFTRNALNKGARLVVAIEPEPQNVESLRRTYANEIAAGRVVVYPKGVWDKDDVLSMKIYPNSALDTFVMQERRETQDQPIEVKLPLTTIDKLVAELKLERVDFLKMDIEGAERNALRGGAETLRKWKPRMSIATENLRDDQQVVPEVVREIAPGYRHEFGGCSVVGFEVRPDVVFFSASR